MPFIWVLTKTSSEQVVLALGNSAVLICQHAKHSLRIIFCCAAARKQARPLHSLTNLRTPARKRTGDAAPAPEDLSNFTIPKLKFPAAQSARKAPQPADATASQHTASADKAAQPRRSPLAVAPPAPAAEYAGGQQAASAADQGQQDAAASPCQQHGGDATRSAAGNAPSTVGAAAAGSTPVCLSGGAPDRSAARPSVSAPAVVLAPAHSASAAASAAGAAKTAPAGKPKVQSGGTRRLLPPSHAPPQRRPLRTAAATKASVPAAAKPAAPAAATLPAAEPADAQLDEAAAAQQCRPVAAARTEPTVRTPSKAAAAEPPPAGSGSAELEAEEAPADEAAEGSPVAPPPQSSPAAKPPAMQQAPATVQQMPCTVQQTPAGALVQQTPAAPQDAPTASPRGESDEEDDAVEGLASPEYCPTEERRRSAPKPKDDSVSSTVL